MKTLQNSNYHVNNKKLFHLGSKAFFPPLLKNNKIIEITLICILGAFLLISLFITNLN